MAEVSRLHRAAYVAVALFAIAIRLVHINQPMRGDEAWTFMEFALRPVSDVLSDYTIPNNHILHTLLVKLSTAVFGEAEWAIRLPAFIAGVLLVPATYMATRALANRHAALLAAALVAALPGLVLYSTNARGYSMICLAFVTLIILADRLADGDSRTHWIAFAVVLALGGYTIPVMLYPAGVVGLWLLAERWRRQGIPGLRALVPSMAGAVALAAALALVAYAPVLMRSGSAPLVGNVYVTPHTWPRVAADLRWILGIMREVHGLGISREVIVVFAALAMLPFFAKREERMKFVTLAAAFLFWAAVLVVATRRPPPARGWLFVAPLAALYVGAGLAQVLRWLTRARPAHLDLACAGMALVIALAIGVKPVVRREILHSPENATFRDGEAVVRWFLAQDSGTDRVVCFAFSEPIIDYYLYRIANTRLRDVAAPTRTGRVFMVANDVRGETVATLKFGRKDVNWAALSEPVLRQRFPRARVYEASPMSP